MREFLKHPSGSFTPRRGPFRRRTSPGLRDDSIGMCQHWSFLCVLDRPDLGVELGDPYLTTQDPHRRVVPDPPSACLASSFFIQRDSTKGTMRCRPKDAEAVRRAGSTGQRRPLPRAPTPRSQPRGGGGGPAGTPGLFPCREGSCFLAMREFLNNPSDSFQPRPRRLAVTAPAAPDVKSLAFKC